MSVSSVLFLSPFVSSAAVTLLLPLQLQDIRQNIRQNTITKYRNKMVRRIVFLLSSICLTFGEIVPKDPLQRFIWPTQWQAVQKVHLVSGNFTGAVQLGTIVYDYVNLKTREDQALISGPSVKTSFTSDNMTEWFHNTTWHYMDWTTGICQTADFGFGQVKPDFLVSNSFPKKTGTIYIDAYIDSGIARGFVNTSWIQTDGSAGFDSPPGTSLFEWYLDANDNARRMRMPSSLSSDLIIDLWDLKNRLMRPTLIYLMHAAMHLRGVWDLSHLLRASLHTAFQTKRAQSRI